MKSTSSIMIKKILDFKLASSSVIKILRSSALILLIVLGCFIFYDLEKYSFLIAPFGVIIAALLASYSAILAIETTIEIKHREISNQVRYIFFHLCQIKMMLIILNNTKKQDNISHIELNQIFNYAEEIYKMILEVKPNEIVSVIHNNMLSDMHFVIARLRIYMVTLKEFKNNIYKSDNLIPPVNNPLIAVDFQIDDTIIDLTNILTYLKEGYPNDFNENGGIEACADYEKRLQAIKIKIMEEKL